MKKLGRFVIYLFIIYSILCTALYFIQENLIFHPQKITAQSHYRFSEAHEELNFTMPDQTRLNGVLLKTSDSCKGLIFYLHGNSGSADGWGEHGAKLTQYGYDVFVLDYRGYGKSEGQITSEKQLHDDVKNVFNSITKKYYQQHKKIVVLGYSIGTGPSAKLASENKIDQLFLLAPYYSFTDLVVHKIKIFPPFLVKYKFKTNEYISQCKMPITLFHGNADEVIYYESSLKLKALLKSTDTLIILENQGHKGIHDNVKFRETIKLRLK